MGIAELPMQLELFAVREARLLIQLGLTRLAKDQPYSYRPIDFVCPFHRQQFP